MGNKLYQVWLKPIYKEHNIYVGTPLDIKKNILGYLTSFKSKQVTSARVIDKVTGVVRNIVNNSYSDGEYQYSGADIFHFEKYNMPLSDEFVNYFVNYH